MSKLINDIQYNDFNDLVKASGLTKEELHEIKLKNQIICELIKARQGKGITQKELEAISGVKQPLIARIEKGNVDPQITTLLRILLPLGLTLAVVPESNQEI
ncbi:MAG: helix-turn-helix domain-containing protein [Clostridiaceae bacterium]|nr:helix-turn-helix domain-containing protein [Clostridiaceae bacterium]